MCGICGILSFKQESSRHAFWEAVQGMANSMRRRGPDDEGLWADPQGRLHFGFRRLSVIEPGSAGHQPMISSDGRSSLVFNGEIYNHRELRKELEEKGIRFRSHSDTEVLLEALNLLGLAALDRLNGMFAFAWYRTDTKVLILARDHAGIKPLYYATFPGKGLVFGSQYNLLLMSPWGNPGLIRLDVLRLYLRLHHIPPPYGMLENTFQLEPGHYLQINADGSIQKKSWWRLPEDPRPDLSGTEALDYLEEVLNRAVRRHRIADVPLGVFLSGGIDSPLVTALARRQTDASLKAFTISSPGWWQDEGPDALRYAKELDVDYHELRLTEDDVLAVIDDVMEAQHEPFADFSIIPTLIVSKFARSELTVALSGDGGDELFFGYERPLSLLRDGRFFRWPWSVRAALYAAGKYGFGPKRSDVIVAPSPGDYYFGVNSRLNDTDLARIAPNLPGLPDDFDLYKSRDYQGEKGLADYSRRVEFYGQMQRCLKKVDMASMHHSLEVRVPLLDREVIETSLRIDPFYCMQDGQRKVPLRRLLERYVPADIIPKRKRGFAVPLAEWLRGPLRPIVEETLFSGDLIRSGIFYADGLQAYWKDHMEARRDNKWGLWTLLALQWWWSKYSNAPK